MAWTKVKKDEKGFYVLADGFKARPIFDNNSIKTKFKEGDKISVTRPAGNTAFVKEKTGYDIKPELWKTEEYINDEDY